MPYSNNRYFLTEPFLFYEMKAIINHEGKV